MNQISLNINPAADNLSHDGALITYRDMDDGFVYSLEDIRFKASEFKSFIDELSTHLGELTKYDYSSGKNAVNVRYKNSQVRIYVRGNSIDLYMSAYSTSEYASEIIWKTYSKYIVRENDIDVFVTSYYMNGNQLDNNYKQMKVEDLRYLSKDYYPYIDTDMMFDQFFTGSENIFLIVGEPGLGKSKMSTLAIRHAYNNPDKLPYDKMADNPGLEEQFINIVYVKSVDVLVNDQFWRKLEAEQADIVVIDDLDYMLTRRDGEVQSADDIRKNIFLNQFLSFTDGVEKSRTKFIITTNQAFDEIDSALLRKGRLFDIIELRRLHRAEALVIWEQNGLPESEFSKVFTTQEILPANLGSEISKRLNKRIKKSTESYLREDGISKIQRAGRTKRVGF
jgi:hypothetical protein